MTNQSPAASREDTGLASRIAKHAFTLAAATALVLPMLTAAGAAAPDDHTQSIATLGEAFNRPAVTQTLETAQLATLTAKPGSVQEHFNAPTQARLTDGQAVGIYLGAIMGGLAVCTVAGLASGGKTYDSDSNSNARLVATGVLAASAAYGTPYPSLKIG